MNDKQVAVRGYIHSTRYMSSSQGNPRYLVQLTDGRSYKTKPSAAIGYGITNSEFQGVLVEFDIDENGDIRRAEPVGGSDE
jgi:hypothetical protein